jgi:nucleoid-associated protein YgaU
MELGDASRWVEIAHLNGLRDPRATTPGKVIRLP